MDGEVVNVLEGQILSVYDILYDMNKREENIAIRDIDDESLDNDTKDRVVLLKEIFSDILEEILLQYETLSLSDWGRK